MDIATLLGSVKTATEIATWFKDSAGSLEKAETKLKMAELISALADVKIEAAEIQQQLLQRDADLRSLREQLAVQKSVRWQRPFYWTVDGTNRDGPFCQRCYDVDMKLVRVQLGRDNFGSCRQCKCGYKAG